MVICPKKEQKEKDKMVMYERRTKKRIKWLCTEEKKEKDEMVMY